MRWGESCSYVISSFWGSARIRCHDGAVRHLGSLDIAWAVVLGLGVVVGIVGTGALLRLRVAREAERSEARVASGELLWWSHVRERRAVGGWGHSGELWLGADGLLRLVPDAASRRRGAQPEAWALDTTEFSLGPRRRDITGISYAILTVRSQETGRTRWFGCRSQRGHIPAEFGAHPAG